MINDLPKHKRIKHLLKEELCSGKFSNHDRFYSERELQQTFSASIPTIRMALKDLITEGLIYREHGRGTFVAPHSGKNKILIVGRFSPDKMASDFGLLEFLRSFLGATIGNNESFSPVTIDSSRFTNISQDLRFHFPEAKGILFFRDHEVLLKNKNTLDEAKLPYFFYGSNTSETHLSGVNCCFHKEEELISTGLDHLLSKYGQTVGFVCAEKSTVHSRRKVLYQNEMRARGLTPKVYELENLIPRQHDHNHRELTKWMPQLQEECRALFCVDDWLALYCQSAAQRMALKMPEDLAILGINDYPFCELVYPSLSSIKIPVYEDGVDCLSQLIKIIEGEFTENRTYSQPELISRMSA